MRPIIATFAAITLAAGLALAASAATAGGTRTTYTQNGVTWSTPSNTDVFASRTRNRALSEHRHGGHFGSPTHGSFGREGVYSKSLYDAMRANNRRAKSRVDVGRD